MRKIVAVISDTHGLIRDEVVNVLVGSNLVIHAGDIGSPDVLEKIRKIAPIVAVRGNVDKGEWTNKLSWTELVKFDGVNIYVIHDIHQLDIDLQDAGVDIVVSGHSHKPIERRADGIIYINPGSAGPKRFSLPISIALIIKYGKQVEVEFRQF
jgi:uncharacterized protein